METAPFTGCSLHQRNRRSSRGKCSHRHRHIRIRRLPPLISADISTLRRREITYEPRRCCDGLPVAMPRFDLSQAHAPLSAAAFVESSLGMLGQQDWDGLLLSLWPSPLGTIVPGNCFRLNKSVSSGAFTLGRDASLEREELPGREHATSGPDALRLLQSKQRWPELEMDFPLAGG